SPRACPPDGQVGAVPVRNPALGPAAHPIVAIPTGAGGHARRVRAELGFGEPKTADHLTLRHPREPALLLLFRAVTMDGEHAQRSLDRDKTAQPAVAALQFLAGEPVHHVAHAGGTVALNMHAEHAEAGQLRN